MKRLLTILFLFALMLSARAQYFAVGMDSNGVVQATGWIRGTNFFQTNISRFMAAWTNDAAARAWLSNNFAYLNRTNRFSQTNFFTTIEANVALLRNGAASNMVIDGLTATNFSAPGAGADSLKIGTGAIADGVGATAIGNSAVASNDFGIAFGYSSTALGAGALALGPGAFASNDLASPMAIGGGAIVLGQNSIGLGVDSFVLPSHTNSMAIGFEAQTTAADQVRIATASQHVSIAGEIRDPRITNSFLAGSNVFGGSFVLLETNATGMASGDVLLNLAPTKTLIELSGNGAAINICGIKNGQAGREIWILKTNAYNVVFKNLSGAAGTAASERVFTGTGADVTRTNTPGLYKLIYSGGLSAWVLQTPL